MKLLGAILVLISSGGIGFFYASELKRRRTALEEEYSLMRLLLGDIRYMRATLPEALNRAKQRHKGGFEGFLGSMAKKLSEASGKEFCALWREAVEEEMKHSAFSKEDKQRMIRFAESIAAAERETVIACFEQFLCEIREELERVNRVTDSKAKLYRSLGVLTGIFIVVLFL